MTSQRSHSSVLVVGSGLAGSITALRLARCGIPVTLLSASKNVENANSWLAQGGIIYRSRESGDTIRLEEDILDAGHCLNLQDAVAFLSEAGPVAVEELLIDSLEVPFDKLDDTGTWDLTREGGHSSHRILHCADHTGLSIMRQVMHAVKNESAITFLQGYSAIDLLTSHHHTSALIYRYQLEDQGCGADVLNENTGGVETMLADITVLATGGAGQVYLHTSNASTATGSGIAMASRAFVRLMNMEYMQFHPTTLFHIEPRRFLITEALRGEGARLVNAAGERFMERYDSRADLAPRDVVARGIVDELLTTGEPCVFLDLSGVKQDLEARFPTVFKSCIERGVHIRIKRTPHAPSVQYI